MLVPSSKLWRRGALQNGELLWPRAFSTSSNMVVDLTGEEAAVDLTGEEAAVAGNDVDVDLTGEEAAVAADDGQTVTKHKDDDAADILDCEASFDHDRAEAAKEPDDEGESDGGDSSHSWSSIVRYSVPGPPPRPAPAPPAAPTPGLGGGPPLSVVGGVIQIVNFYISESDVRINTIASDVA
jgi:hypothetical protein